MEEKKAYLFPDQQKHHPSGFSVGDRVQYDYLRAEPFGFASEASSAGVGTGKVFYILAFAEMEMHARCIIRGTFVVLARFVSRWDDGIIGNTQQHYFVTETAGKIDEKYPEKVLLFPVTCLVRADPGPQS